MPGCLRALDVMSIAAGPTITKGEVDPASAGLIQMLRQVGGVLQSLVYLLVLYCGGVLVGSVLDLQQSDRLGIGSYARSTECGSVTYRSTEYSQWLATSEETW